MSSPSLPASAPSPLDQLADIHLPPAVSPWPLAPGWWLLMGLCLLVLVALWCVYAHRQRNRYRRVALDQLRQLSTDYQRTQDAATYLHALSVLLRRTALTAYPGRFNASLKGDAWLQWLDDTCPALRTNKNARGATFMSDLGQSLTQAAYQKHPSVDAPGLEAVCACWIAHHLSARRYLARPATASSVNLRQGDSHHV